MPPVFQVLRCYKCSVFQVHQTRKDNKWVCKLCGEKQSVKRHYGIGTAKDCRLHVQKLNNMRGEKEETIKICISDGSDYDETIENNTEITNTMSIIDTKSKWTAYVDKPEDKDVNEPQYLNNLEIEFPKKRKISTYRKQNMNIKKSTCSVNYNIDETDNIEIIEAKISYNIKSNTNSLQENISTETSHSKLLNTVEILNPQESQPCPVRSSKWYQYLEEDNTNKASEPIVKNCSIKNSLFSLSDDNDIDKILAF